MPIQPLVDRTLIKLMADPEKSPGGIILPDPAKEKPQEGKVVAVGKGRMLEMERSPAGLKVGTRSLRENTDEINEGQKEFTILREDDILAVLKKELNRVLTDGEAAAVQR